MKKKQNCWMAWVSHFPDSWSIGLTIGESPRPLVKSSCYWIAWNTCTFRSFWCLLALVRASPICWKFQVMKSRTVLSSLLTSVQHLCCSKLSIFHYLRESSEASPPISSHRFSWEWAKHIWISGGHEATSLVPSRCLDRGTRTFSMYIHSV